MTLWGGRTPEPPACTSYRNKPDNLARAISAWAFSGLGKGFPGAGMSFSWTLSTLRSGAQKQTHAGEEGGWGTLTQAADAASDVPTILAAFVKNTFNSKNYKASN